MRNILIALMLALTLLAAPVALASRGEDRHEKREAAQAEHDDGPREDDDNETHGEARHKNATARQEWRENFTARRTAAWDAFHAKVTLMRASWIENATRIREACHVETPTQNATEEDRKADAHCVRDGYREWRADNRADMRILHKELNELFGGWGKRHHRA